MARESLRSDLAKCTDAQRNLFARMYGSFGINDTIETVVDGMPADKLDWAMLQVQRTLDKK